MLKRVFPILLSLFCLLSLAACGTPEGEASDMNGNSFKGVLECRPAVFAVGDSYEITVLCRHNGIIYIKVGDSLYRPENSGVLSSDKRYAKIRLPISELDRAGKYTVGFSKTVKRLSYYSKMSSAREFEFEFSPLRKTNGVKIYHFADIHGHFELAKKCLADFGAADMLICNGDIADSGGSKKAFFDVCKFLGEAALGKIPIVFTRGNHETRGPAAPIYTELFPADSSSCFYGFSLGCIDGIVLDCGEDKLDRHKEYGGVNDFHAYRLRETRFLEKASFPADGKWHLVISHICPAQTSENEGDIFDIERDIYTRWSKELERLGIDFMLCGHMHTYNTLDSESEENLVPHTYPVFTASMLKRGKKPVFGGAGIVLNEGYAEISYTDSDGKASGRYRITKGSKNIEELTPRA